ncbi:MAG: collagen-like protein [Flavobacteriales bacterium]|nr:MAG: collagen-like protein [Flavobacteriales bacterium]
MERLTTLFAICTIILTFSCTGPAGPPGYDNIGKVFEATINFNQDNDYSRLITFPSDIVVYESDVVMVYMLEDVVNGDIDVWSQLPQTYFLNQGTLLYTFDHTFLDVNIFLDANFNLNTLGSNYTDNQVFRIAILPAEYGTSNLSMNQLMNDLNIEDSDISVLHN